MKTILIKILLAITALPFVFAMVMIFPCLGIGLIGLLVDVALYIQWPFTGFSPFNLTGEFMCGIWLPLYSCAALHMWLSGKVEGNCFFSVV